MPVNQLSDKLQRLQTRFHDVMAFLKRTTITHLGEERRLTKLPWYLYVSTTGAGKTSLLAHSNIPFVLQRKFQSATSKIQITPSDNIDFWVTREACIVDVPSQYFTMRAGKIDARIWQYCLSQIKNERGKHAISGLLLALPHPDVMRDGEIKQYYTRWNQLFQFINELQAFFPDPIPCYLTITKCDLVPGFAEFFSESTDDEIMQPWGITLPAIQSNNQLESLLIGKFDLLIKKLNQQLLFRLHHERDPFAKLAIKDFPLQVERLKMFTLDFVKKYMEKNAHFPLRGIYLTSALQKEKTQTFSSVESSVETTAIQIYKAPILSRAYFIKQFISQNLAHTELPHKTYPKRWRQAMTYTAFGSIVLIASMLLGENFIIAAQKTQALKNTLTTYQQSIQHADSDSARLKKTIALLNEIRPHSNTHSLFSLKRVFSFYSNRVAQQSNTLYNDTLKNAFIPQLSQYLNQFLITTNDRDIDSIYFALKAYCLLQATDHFEPTYMANALVRLLAPLPPDSAVTLAKDMQAALQIGAIPIPVNTDLIIKIQDNLSMKLFQNAIIRLHLAHPKDLAETDEMITQLIQPSSSLMQSLKILHDDPIFESRLASNTLTPSSDHLIDQIMTRLQSLHQLLYTVLTAPDPHQAAADLVAKYSEQHQPDSITKLHALAKKSPMTIKYWLNHISDEAWRYLAQNATAEQTPG